MLDLERWDKIGGWMTKSEGQYLYDQVSASPDGSRIVEIGSYRGRSTAALLQACADTSPNRLKKVIAVDLFVGDGSQVAKPSEDEQKSSASKFYDTIYTCQLHPWLVRLDVMSSEEWFEINQDSYDMFFIDGCHPRVAFDVKEAWRRLKPGGILLVHDYDPAVKTSQVVRDVDVLCLGGAHCGVYDTSIYKAVK